MNGPYLIIAFVALIALFYFMTIRPQRKQAEKQREMHNSIEPGTRVMLTSGIYGTVTAMGDKQFVLELAPGVDITVLKQAIVRTVAPEDEEFEFADSTVVPDDASSLAGPDSDDRALSGPQSDTQTDTQANETQPTEQKTAFPSQSPEDKAPESKDSDDAKDSGTTDSTKDSGSANGAKDSNKPANGATPDAGDDSADTEHK